MSNTVFVLIAFIGFAVFGNGVSKERHDATVDAATAALIIAVLWDIFSIVMRWRNSK